MRNRILPALKAAFPHTLPVMAGYLFLGITYGISMTTKGFSVFYPIAMAICIYGGSLEFVCITMLLSSFAPLQTFMMAFMIQARHLFYSIAMLDKYKHLGKKRFYLIFSLSDETFSVNCSTPAPKNVDQGLFYFLISLMDQCYWITGATIGGLVGTAIPTTWTRGLEFVMTAMFAAIFMDRWLKEKKHYTALIGVIASVACLLLFGRDNFMIPTMICMLVMLTVLWKPIEKAGGFIDDDTH